MIPQRGYLIGSYYLCELEYRNNQAVYKAKRVWDATELAWFDVDPNYTIPLFKPWQSDALGEHISDSWLKEPPTHDEILAAGIEPYHEIQKKKLTIFLLQHNNYFQPLSGFLVLIVVLFGGMTWGFGLETPASPLLI